MALRVSTLFFKEKNLQRRSSPTHYTIVTSALHAQETLTPFSKDPI